VTPNSISVESPMDPGIRERSRRTHKSLSALTGVVVTAMLAVLVPAVSAQATSYGDQTVYGVPSSAQEASFDNSSGTGEGVFFIVGGIRLFDEQDGTVITDTSGREETICTTTSGSRVSPFSFYSGGWYSGHTLGVVYFDNTKPSGDAHSYVSWNGHNWQISGATNAHS